MARSFSFVDTVITFTAFRLQDDMPPHGASRTIGAPVFESGSHPRHGVLVNSWETVCFFVSLSVFFSSFFFYVLFPVAAVHQIIGFRVPDGLFATFGEPEAMHPGKTE